MDDKWNMPDEQLIEILRNLGDTTRKKNRNYDRTIYDVAADRIERLRSSRKENEALASRLDSAENAMREVVSHLQRSQRGSTHWAGCHDVHPVCQAIDMLVDALPLRDVERHVTNEETQ